MPGDRSKPVTSPSPASARNAPTWPGPQPTSATGPGPASRRGAPAASDRTACRPARRAIDPRRPWRSCRRSRRPARPRLRPVPQHPARRPTTPSTGGAAEPPRRCVQRRSFWPGGARARRRAARRGRAATPARVHLVQVGEGVQAVGAGPQLARRLRASQQEEGDDGPLAVVERQPLVEHLAVLRGPGPGARVHDPGQALCLQPVDRGEHLVLRDVHHRVAARRLVARRAQRVEGQRVGRRDGPLLLEEAADHAPLDVVEVHGRMLGVVLEVVLRRPRGTTRRGSPVQR